MAITFLCAGCSHQLQVPDEAVGAQAKCPVCGTVMLVPAEDSVSASDEGNAPQEDQPEAASPFGAAGGTPQGPPPGYMSYYGVMPGSPFMAPLDPRRFSIGDAWEDTWAIYKARFWPVVGVVFLCGLMNFGSNIAESIVQTFSQVFGPIGILFYGVAVVAKLVFQWWIQVGLIIYLLNVIAGRRAEISDLFRGARYLLRYIGAAIVFGLGLFVIFALFALLVVGVYTVTGNAFTQQGFENAGPEFWSIGGTLAGIGCICLIVYSYIFILWPFLLIDRNFGAMESLGMSAKLMRGNKFRFVVIQLATGILVAFVGLLTCGIGFIFAAPFMWLLSGVLYYHIAGLPIGRMYLDV